MTMGRLDVDKMLEELSCDQLTEWMEFDSLEPIGDVPTYLMSAQIQALLVNINRDPKKTPSPYSPVDFLPASFKPKPKPLTKEERYLQARAFSEQLVAASKSRAR